ncbi:HAD family hydrolase [Bacillota bacterium Meth-B3]|nr:HAD family phosphatase [Christensenellaceae bacterium]MEA5065901.1 HAD family phosphatase [Eubacteriales bacterium]
MILRFDAMIFDMDGTLLDSMGYWRRINVDFLAARGLTPPEEIRADILETSNRVAARLYAERLDIGMDMAQIMAEYRRRMGVYYQTEIGPKPDALGYVNWLRRRGVRVCVGTASPLDLAVPALERHGLLEPMEFVLSAQDLGMDKGGPDFYRLIAERLNLPCERCAMFEDALYAARGAKAAGLTVYAIADHTQRAHEAELREVADVFVRDFAELM